MANELLDFVMSLVRDPEAAARYAADPSAAIADAHLSDVTSVDVNNLIPVVSDSLSMAAPTLGGPDPAVADAGSNVWTSGAATAAFDSFTPHLPDQAVAAVHDLPGVIDSSALPGGDTGAVPAVDVAQFSDVIDAHSPAVMDAMNEFATDGPTDWEQAVDALHHDASDAGHDQFTDQGPDHSGFDIFS
jgi:hypothetical protein